jgi:N-methylhydantoinase A/oxoprolinase/acetone carboxylase beta subunit
VKEIKSILSKGKRDRVEGRDSRRRVRWYRQGARGNREVEGIAPVVEIDRIYSRAYSVAREEEEVLEDRVEAAGSQKSHRGLVDSGCTDALMQPGVAQNLGLQSIRVTPYMMSFGKMGTTTIITEEVRRPEMLIKRIAISDMAAGTCIDTAQVVRQGPVEEGHPDKMGVVIKGE